MSVPTRAVARRRTARAAGAGLVAGVLACLPAARAAGPPPAGARSDAHWSTLYLLHCSGCHRVDGAGLPGSVPDLRGNLGHFVSTPEGRRFVLQVPGVVQARLPDADVAELTNWMLRAFSAATVPAGFVPYDAQEVRIARASPPADLAGERRRVVAALRAQGLPAR